MKTEDYDPVTDLFPSLVTDGFVAERCGLLLLRSINCSPNCSLFLELERVVD